MQELWAQFFITLLTVCIMVWLYQSRLSYKWKLLIYISILFEGLLFLSSVNKFPIYLSMIIILSSIFFIQKITIIERDISSPIINFNPSSNIKTALTYLRNVSKFFFPFIGITLILSVLILEHLIFDGHISIQSGLILLIGVAWISYNYIPEHYARERDLSFIFLNLTPILLSPSISTKFFNIGTPMVLILIIFIIFISYNHISEEYAPERDFLLLFLSILVLFFVLPTLFYKVFSGILDDSGEGLLNSKEFVNIFLTQPLETLLKLFGFNVWSMGASIYYEDLTAGRVQSVLIAKECSGIYSVVIFISAFMSHIIMNYKSFDMAVAFLLVYGMIMAYIANLLRMMIIVIVGHYWGMDALLWVHANIGWLIFLFWISIFWITMFKILPFSPNNFNYQQSK